MRKYIYCYGVVKFKSDLGMCDLIDKVFIGFLVENLFGKILIFDICMIIDGKKFFNKFFSM